ncbi:MAG: LutB/LldF family L-lactate oxidation iron-sulfur protein [bacterium]|nr:LutB/LldF family L-lactate oxidation iron-sulfur protein [bacterium]
MNVDSNNFIPLAQVALKSPDLQAAVTKGTTNAFTKREAAVYAFGHAHGEAMRQQAAEARRRALRNLPDLLERAEANMTANGMTVLWAEDAAEVNRHVLEIAARHNVRLVAKSKSMVSEEVHLNHALEANHIEVVETDLGEYIIQLNKETPSHIIAPVIHRTKAEIRDILMRVGMPYTDNAEEMTQFAREKLREVFLKAEMGVSGGNFIIAETGTLCMVTNEGNGRMVTAMPPVHVAIVGIEKVIESVADYATLTQILPRSGTGQPMTVYTQMLNGPRRPGEPDGPDHVYIILVDNGRANVYASKYAEALACIRCGACLNACPVYQSTGGHAYGWVYSGPIGAVITPLLTGLENATPLPQASSLCGRCKEVCPVDIDLPGMLLELRADTVEQKRDDPLIRLGIKSWSVGNRSPYLFTLGGRAARIGQRFVPKNRLPGPLAGWTQYRDFPSFAPKSFRELWKERKGN